MPLSFRRAPIVRASGRLLLLAGALLAAVPPLPAAAQAAHISEETRTLATYPFSEPDPVPILARDARLYPYHSFEGYAATAEPREWKVVRLENDHIEVFVLPEVGGKVWGAVVKETGHEFIYRNEVMKFRNIALRGPWTSGGIELNFGVIGHTPATATPVDYVLRDNDDGSVSCIVGAMDLPSRTHWRVEIRLPADAAYFETNVLWYNPTPLTQPYYNWMTAAALARDDLEMFIPGAAYLEHSGRARDWPIDEQGRNLALYRDNDFGSSKSYHVVGELNDFFGGYYHDDERGFGHWARYEEMPGQKLWIWALSPAGGIWEELLTDTDGQYIEFQAGRLLVQYQPGAGVNPITQVGFDPMSASRWSETWFPLEGIGGLSDASRDGALHAVHEGDELTVDVNAFVAVNDTLEVLARGAPVASMPLRLQPLGRFQTTMRLPAGTPYRVRIAGLDLDYASDPAARRLSRPFATDAELIASIPEVDRMVFEAGELYEGRRHGAARDLFEAAIAREPSNRAALLGLAELDYRAGLYEAGIERARRALQLDAYDAAANFRAGTLYRALGRTADARDAFGWAARSMAYRSAAYAQLAEIMIGLEQLDEAQRYARLAIDYDRYSVPAWRVLAVVARLGGDDDLAEQAHGELLALDPLHHFVFGERYLAAPDAGAAQQLVARLGGEYPEQTLLELAVGYVAIGRDDDALALLGIAAPAGAASPAGGAVSPQRPEHEAPAPRPQGDAPATAWRGAPVLQAWRAFLRNDATLLAGPQNPAFAFPFRRESVPVLAWAVANSDDWTWVYFYALNLWAVDRPREAAELFRALGEQPDFAPFYVARARLFESMGNGQPAPESTADYRRAVALDPQSRVLHVYLARHLQDAGRQEEAFAAVTAARALFPDDFNLALLQADSLIHLERAEEALSILRNVHVLPSENAARAHRLWEQAHTLAALDAFEAGDHERAAGRLHAALEWPESLGQGRPYEPEERLVRYLLARVEETRGNTQAARELYEQVVRAGGEMTAASRLDLLSLAALAALRPAELQAFLDREAGGGSAALAARRFAAVVASAPAQRARSELVAIAADHPALFEDVEGRLILRALIAPGR